ncbi:unnamed protein product [Rotaria sordida]|uniref:Kinesin light chain n=1 Tax=Rotaria sordida TaxID=392033 RepID=A0A815Z861_9BILA|nr:unnamed protein product [Rotaria sordida]CAF1579961.1 unnamed protein product [Rotaria sordida]
MATINSSAVSPERMRPILENCLLIWLDADFDESKNDYKQSIQQLRNVIATITTFTDADQCVDYLSDIKDEKVLMIVSGSLGQHVIPEIQACPQLDSVYVFCDNQSMHEQWAKIIPKVKGIYTQVQPICKALQIDRKHCDRSMISMSFRGIDPLFMYTQLLKEAFLEIEDDDVTSIKELVDYCRLHNAASPTTLEMLEREYRHHPPSWWYTGPFFIYSMLNHGLRLMNVDIIMRMGFFIRHLHKHIEKLHGEQQSDEPTNRPLTVFRGQAYNHYLGWLYSDMGEYAKAIIFYEKSLKTRENTTPQNLPDLAASYNGIGSVYDSMGEYSKALSSYEQSLEIMKIALPPNHHDLAVSYNNIGEVYRSMGEYSKALSSHERSLKIRKIALPPNHPDFAQSYNNIGNVYCNTGEYSKALSSYERSLEIKKIALPPNHPNLAASYNNIGLVYDNMGEYSKALSSYERSLEIRKIALPPNHPDLATSYNNIGMVYDEMGEYSKALSSYGRSLEIRKIALTPNHPDFAQSYSNIGSVYDNMGEYSKALSLYERSLEIDKKAVPPNHPDLASSYNNIAVVCNNMGEYSKALQYYEKAQEIWKKSLPSNHPHIALVKNNIAGVKKKM